MYSKEKIEQIIRYIEYARIFMSESFEKDLYLNELNKIQSIKDIENSDVLKPWESSIIYNLEGLEALKREGKKRQNLKTYLIIHPIFIDLYKLIEEELSEFLAIRNDVSKKKYSYRFTKELVTRLYGGTPWFEPYTRICLAKEIFTQNSICYQFLSKEKDCVLDLVVFKNRFREKYPNLELKMNFHDCKLPGKITPFHTPDSVENDNHVRAIENVLLEEVL